MINNKSEHRKIYIEAGANDGIFQSRSIDLSKDESFKGILIEPCKSLFDRCVANRSNSRTSFYNCALVSFDKEAEGHIDLYHSNVHPAMNNVSNWENSISKEKVKAATLASILEKEDVQIVDYLFLDVEGYESEVLKGINFKTVKFKNVEIESHHVFNKFTLEEELKIFQDLLGENYLLNETVTNDGNEKFVFNLKE